MKIVKNTSFWGPKGKYGNFDLIPEEGWKISDSFIDFESGLLIVSESNENEDEWEDTGFGSRIIPSKQYRIDKKKGEILTREEWSQYFNYETQEKLSKDGKYKLITTRVYEPERDSDGIEEELIEVATGKTLSSSSAVAFREDRRENLLESHYANIKKRKEKQAKIDALPTLQELYQQEIKKLKPGTIILKYSSWNRSYQLEYDGSIFKLKRTRAQSQQGLRVPSSKYRNYQNFDDLESFRDAYMKNKQWYLNHKPLGDNWNAESPNYVLKSFVIQFFNELRYHHDFTFSEYENLYQWERFYYQHDHVKPDEYKQYCAHCKSTMSYYPRYPKMICGVCSSKAKSKKGYDLSFSNVGIGGGLRTTYRKDGKIMKEDDRSLEKRCFIEGKRYVATEARFGGIVIQAEK